MHALSQGQQVALLGRSADDMARAIDGRSNGVAYAVDLRDSEACAAAVREIEATQGAIANLVHCAAVYPRAHFIDQTTADFDDTYISNIFGVANMVRATLPLMLERSHGRIVVLGSLADINPLPGSVAYSSSKGALHSLVKGIAAEIDRQRYPDVLINELTPGATRTSMSSYGQAPEEVPDLIQRLLDLPAGGPSGALFQKEKRMHLNETWKGALKRRLGLS